MKKKQWLVVFLCAISFYGGTQQNLLPIHSFYKDKLFQINDSSPIMEGSFYPIAESRIDLITKINDSAPRYSTFTYILFQKHALEIKAKDAFITISPVLNFAMGRDLADTVKSNLFQNTRGVFVEGDLFKKFSFATLFHENQARYTRYQNELYNSLGEFYPNATGYSQQNAVVPGGARTKPFKTSGLDFGFATGYFAYTPIQSLKIIAGNNRQFIGDGHRSLLLSDNSPNAPYFRIDYRPLRIFSMTYFRSKFLNLLRRPASSSAESYYEPKGYSVNYFTFNPSKKMSVSLFEGAIWNRGDSIQSRPAHWLFYNPVPFVSGLVLRNKNEVSSIYGLNFAYQPHHFHRIYGQFAIGDFDAKKLGAQIGYRGYNYFGLKDFMLQVEYNWTTSDLYLSKNPRLSYSNNNVLIGHILGGGMQEVLLRTNYEWKKIYADLAVNFIATSNHSSVAHLPVYQNPVFQSGTVYNQQLELGYRFNRKINLCVFVNWQFRTATYGTKLTNAISAGLKTSLINQYRDF